jgi:hypothetical protein
MSSINTALQTNYPELFHDIFHVNMNWLLSPFTNYTIIFLEGLYGVRFCVSISTECTKYFSVQNLQVYYVMA